jgi:hypothetical protein
MHRQSPNLFADLEPPPQPANHDAARDTMTPGHRQPPARQPMAPHNGTPTSIAGARHIEPEARHLGSMVASALHSAGAPSRDGSAGGMTIQELADAITKRRGNTKETTICPRLNELVVSGHVIKTDLTRLGNAGVKVSVWCHRLHWRDWMGNAKQAPGRIGGAS